MTQRGANLEGLEPASRMSLSDEIITKLRERILSGELRPGDRIAELDVANAFGTSQAPVREAFSAMRSEGLIVTLPRRGTFVSGVSLADARASYEVRRMLDPYVAAEAIPRLTKDDISRLRAVASEMDTAAKAGDLERLTRFDMELHGLLWHVCESPVMGRIWDSLSASVRKFIVVAGPEVLGGDLPTVAAMHAELVDMIIDRDVEAVKQELSRQLDYFWARVEGSNGA